LKGDVETLIIYVLADDPYAYLNAHNIHFAFFAVRFCAPMWVRWIICGSGCSGLFTFITTFVL